MSVEAQERSSLMDDETLEEYKGFWLLSKVIKCLPLIESKYKPLPTDVLIASYPKSGTTSLKALTYTILHFHNPKTNDLLQTQNPHQLVPFLEMELFGEIPHKIHFDDLPSPRIFNTHIPYSILPEKVKESSSGCKIIYVSRNPADTIVSGWEFYNKAFGRQQTLQEYFDEFIKGINPSGPVFDHVLEYWEERKRENMLFITFEGLKKYPNENVRRIAWFLGCSLSEDEIEQVVRKTSFERLSKLDINTNGERRRVMNEQLTVPNSLFFRNGNMGDGKKRLTPAMMERLNAIAYKKWGGSGLESNLLDVEP